MENRLTKLEEHCGVQVQNRRLRFHIMDTIKELEDEIASLKNGMINLTKGFATFDPTTSKVVAKRKS